MAKKVTNAVAEAIIGDIRDAHPDLPAPVQATVGRREKRGFIEGHRNFTVAAKSGAVTVKGTPSCPSWVDGVRLVQGVFDVVLDEVSYRAVVWFHPEPATAPVADEPLL